MQVELPMGRSLVRIALVGRDADRLLAFRGSLVNLALRAGHEVHAFTRDSGEAASRRLAEAGVRWASVPLDAAGLHPVRDLGYRRALARLFRERGIEAVLAYNPKCLAHAPVAARRSGVRRVVALVTGLGHGFTGTGLAEGLVRLAKASLYRRAFHRCDAVLVQNPQDLEDLAACGAVDPARARIRVVAGSGVDLCAFPEASLPPHPRFLMISRPLRTKGLPEYLEAARMLRMRMPEAACAWLGPARDANPASIPADRLVRLLQASGVSRLAETDDVRPAITACSTFVLPSHREGTSKVVLEAMATGRAIVTTDAPGCRDTVVHGVNGLVVPVGDAVALHEAMERLARDAALRARMGEASRRMAASRFDAASVDATILDELVGPAAR